MTQDSFITKPPQSAADAFLASVGASSFHEFLTKSIVESKTALDNAFCAAFQWHATHDSEGKILPRAHVTARPRSGRREEIDDYVRFFVNRDSSVVWDMDQGNPLCSWTYDRGSIGITRKYIQGDQYPYFASTRSYLRSENKGGQKSTTCVLRSGYGIDCEAGYEQYSMGAAIITFNEKGVTVCQPVPPYERGDDEVWSAPALKLTYAWQVRPTDSKIGTVVGATLIGCSVGRFTTENDSTYNNIKNPTIALVDIPKEPPYHFEEHAWLNALPTASATESFTIVETLGRLTIKVTERQTRGGRFQKRLMAALHIPHNPIQPREIVSFSVGGRIPCTFATGVANALCDSRNGPEAGIEQVCLPQLGVEGVTDLAEEFVPQVSVL